MLKRTVIWAFMLTILSFSAASSKFIAKDCSKDSQIVLKSFAEFCLQGHLYKPLRIYTKVIEESFNNDKIDKNLQLALENSAKIMSDLLLTKSSSDKIRLSGNHQCTDILLSRIIHIEDLEADIAIFAFNNEEKEEIISSKKCDVNKTLKFLVLEINAEKLMKLDNFSQIKEIFIEISKALYEDNEEERQTLLNQIERVLSKEREIKIIPILGACAPGINNCITCDSQNVYCVACQNGYFVNNGACSVCNANCGTCTTSAENCVTCSDINHMSAAPNCVCNSNSVLSGTSCVCNAGYFYLKNVCTACNANCAACTTSATSCSTCSDPTHQTSVPSCACKSNSSLSGSLCVCNAGFYYVGTVCTACSSNCAACTTSAGNCVTCSDINHMSAAPACACNANSILSGTTCVCNAGYFYSANVCTVCNSNCATCTTAAATCATCSDSTHMSAAQACACNANSSLIGTTCVCKAGYFYKSNVCTVCNTNCATCTTSATNCVTCSDPTHMSAAPSCACTTNSSLSGTTCVCKAGYVYSNNVCTICNINCVTCTTSTSNCVTCSDPKHMSAAPACACNANSALSGISCVCNTGYFYLNNVCTACNANCGTCTTSAAKCVTCSDPNHMSAASACTCNANSVLSGTTCACNAGYFYSGNVCTVCNTNCATCTTSAGNCVTCSDPNHMSAAPTCACNANSVLQGSTCVCNAGYLYSNNVCTACNANCVTCTTSIANCATCSDPTHMSAAPACACNANSALSGTTCVCNANYFYLKNVCTACNVNCGSCTTSAGNCVTCSDPNHMSAAPNCVCTANSVLTGTTCVCNAGYHYLNNVCNACNNNCATCITSAENCLTCSDPTHMSAVPACACNANSSLSGTTCVCNVGYFYSGNVCTACNSNCVTCTTSASTCVTCSDPNHMNAAPNCACTTNSVLTGTTCVCNAGYFYLSNVCTACNSNCGTCTTSAGNCVTCSDPNHMSAAPNCACTTNSVLTGTTCVCNAGYFYSNNVCVACNTNCATCTTAADNCVTCSDTNHMSTAPTCACNANSALSGATCVCNAGYFYSGNVCTVCSSNCATCTTSAGNCATCSDPNHMSAAPACSCTSNSALQGTTCVCNAGYFYSNNLCSACNANCATCDTSADNCDTCSDATHMSAAPSCSCPTNGSLSGTTCTCNPGYFFSSNTVCTACNSNCATCDTSAGNCDTCSDPNHMSAAPACACNANSALSGSLCVCNAGYFYSGNVCTVCSTNCATCTTAANQCDTCIDTNHMSAAPDCACPTNGSFTSGVCVCNTGYYYSSNTVCSACTAPCSACSTSATTCTACEDGYYLSGNACLQCTAPCATCSISATVCNSCDDATHMTLSAEGDCTCNDPNATFSITSNACVCNSDYWDNAGVCTQCTLPCNVCTSATVCQGCIDGYWLNGQACNACTPPCSKCSTSGTACTACIDGTTLNAVASVCLCNDPNASFNDNNNACLCNPGYFENAGTCIICTSPCATCSGTAANCLSCDDEFFLNGNRCDACASGCKLCTSTTACTQCIDDTSFSTIQDGICGCSDPNQYFNTQGFCTCNFGYFTAGDKCSTCNNGCKACLNAGVCVVCWDATYGTINDDGSCTCKLIGQTYDNIAKVCNCPNHYYPNTGSGNCELCSMGCSECNSTSCSECYDAANMEPENDGTCSCTDNKKRFTNSNDKCIDRGDSAIGLNFSWILIISTMIFSF